jgi:hypothetical protein
MRRRGRQFHHHRNIVGFEVFAGVFEGAEDAEPYAQPP